MDCLPHSARVTSLRLMEEGAPTHYLVVEGLAGEGSTWRVVRAEEHARGRSLYAFVGTCQTRRAALSLARALNEKRAVDEATLRAAAQRGQALPPGRADIAPAPRSLPAQAFLLRWAVLGALRSLTDAGQASTDKVLERFRSKRKRSKRSAS